MRHLRAIVNWLIEFTGLK